MDYTITDKEGRFFFFKNVIGQGGILANRPIISEQQQHYYNFQSQTSVSLLAYMILRSDTQHTGCFKFLVILKNHSGSIFETSGSSFPNCFSIALSHKFENIYPLTVEFRLFRNYKEFETPCMYIQCSVAIYFCIVSNQT